jgi:hypothetical protein
MQNLLDAVKITLTRITSISVPKNNLAYLLLFVLKGQVYVSLGRDRKFLQENDIYLIKKNTAAKLSSARGGGGGGKIVLIVEKPSDFIEVIF